VAGRGTRSSASSPWGPGSLRVRGTVLGGDPRRPARSAALRPSRSPVDRRDRGGRGPHHQRRTDRRDLRLGGRLRFLCARLATSSWPRPPRISPGRRRAATSPRGGGMQPVRGDLRGPRRGSASTGSASHQHGRLDQKGRGRRADPAQHRSVHPVPALQPLLTALLWNRPGIGRVEPRHDPPPAGWSESNPPVGLLDHRRGRARRTRPRATPRPSAARRCCLSGPSGVLAVQASATRPRERAAERGGASTSAGGLPLSVIVIDYFHWTRQGRLGSSTRTSGPTRPPWWPSWSSSASS